MIFLNTLLLQLVTPNLGTQNPKQLQTLRKHNTFSIIFEHLCYYPTPSSLSYIWGLGFTAGLFLVIQIITGIILVMHYKPSSLYAFSSIAHLMYDVPSGWLIRYLHANGGSVFFILIYLHIGRGVYHGSFITPRNWIWVSGIIIFFLAICTAFIGYVLPWGQISFWGGTVITNIVSSIPLVGTRIVLWVWGNYAIADSTLNRFFSLHYLLPFILLVVVIVHLYLLHIPGSNAPTGLITPIEIIKLPFYPFFLLKDIVGFLAVIVFFIYLVFFDPNLLGHTDNYIIANPIVTPTHIVPEWYFLPFYAVLRAIPNKFMGVVFIVGAILVNLFHVTIIIFERLLPDASLRRSISGLFFSRNLFWFFISNFLLLGFIGGRPVETPYFELGQLSTFFFFLYWFIAPLLYAIELQYHRQLLLHDVELNAKNPESISFSVEYEALQIRISLENVSKINLELVRSIATQYNIDFTLFNGLDEQIYPISDNVHQDYYESNCLDLDNNYEIFDLHAEIVNAAEYYMDGIYKGYDIITDCYNNCFTKRGADRVEQSWADHLEVIRNTNNYISAHFSIDAFDSIKSDIIQNRKHQNHPDFTSSELDVIDAAITSYIKEYPEGVWTPLPKDEIYVKYS